MFIWLGVLRQFDMEPDVYILLSPQWEDLHSSWGDRRIYSAVHSSKRFKPFSAIMLLCQGYCWIRKNTNKEFNCVMMLIIRLSTILQLQLFLVQWMSLGNLFPMKFLHFLAIYFGCVSVIIITDNFKSHHECPFTSAHIWKTWVKMLPNVFHNVEKNL